MNIIHKIKNAKPCEALTETVLIVDDDTLVRQCLKKILTAAHYFVRDFSSAETFIQSQCIKEADCLILDIRLQGMSGFDLQTYLSYQGSQVPVIYLTGFADDQHRQLAESLGAAAFFSKPINGKLLLEAVKKAIKQ